MKSPEEVFNIIKKGLDEKEAIAIKKYSYDFSERTEFKQNNFNVSFIYSYVSVNTEYDDGDNYIEQNSFESKITNLEVSDLEVDFKGNPIILTDDQNKELLYLIECLIDS